MSKTSENLTTVISSLDSKSQRVLARYSMHILNTISAQVGQQIRLTDADKIRVLRWLTWSRRFQVPLSYVIAKAFAWGQAVVQSKNKFQRRPSLLPLTITVMTGQTCMEYVQQCVEDDAMAGTVNLRALPALGHSTLPVRCYFSDCSRYDPGVYNID
jgi:hypothetical protein